MVPEGGLEPPQGYPYRILSPARLPFRHFGAGITLFQDRAGVSPGQVRPRLIDPTNALVPPSPRPSRRQADQVRGANGIRCPGGSFTRAVQHRHCKA